MARLKQFWIEIKSSFWFIPALINIFLIFLAISVIEVDQILSVHKHKIPFPFISFEQESIRTFLATIAGSMMTIAGVVFSITILVLAQTAGQYSSRVLRTFMKKKNNQIILGIFIGIFIFCLFLITNIHPTNNTLTTLSGFALALIGVSFLIYYIHQTSISIQATEILKTIYEETSRTIDQLYPNIIEKEITPAEKFNEPFDIYSEQVGFLQAIDLSALLQLGKKYDTKIEIHPYTGKFITLGEKICSVGKDLKEDLEFMQQFTSTLVIGKYRTETQDVAYGIQQISDIALRGLSLAINDFTTAQTALHYLTSLYTQLVNRDFGFQVLSCENRPIIYCSIQDFSLFLDSGLRALYECAKQYPFYQEKLNESIQKIQEKAKIQKRKGLLNHYTFPTPKRA